MRVRFRCDPVLAPFLPPPVPARDCLPEWLRTMPASSASILHGDAPVRTLKHCPPFIDAMAEGFILPLPCDVNVADGILSWDWPIPEPAVSAHPRAPLSFHSAAQVAGTPFANGDRSVVKFNSFWTIELEPGCSLSVFHPANRDDLPFRLLSGVVDADRFHQVGVLFPALWRDPAFSGTLPRGTPVAQCLPFRREALELDIAPLDAAGREDYAATARILGTESGWYRRTCRAPRPRD
ncbi:MAG: hypothetical protein INR65_17320 [Gluconacetobacter diazotrophicus]|nr:hypothetical protein [Gluconacetobacter diazotrophicus]